MTTHYTKSEDRWLKEKAEAAGYISTLELCSDGIYRTPEERQNWESAGCPETVTIARAP